MNQPQPTSPTCVQTRTIQEGTARREEQSFPCDLCHRVPGGDFFDRFWVCPSCRTKRERWIEGERCRGKFHVPADPEIQ